MRHRRDVLDVLSLIDQSTVDLSVFRTINRIVVSGNTIVTADVQTSDGVVRQQFFASPDSGASWHLAPVPSRQGGRDE